MNSRSKMQKGETLGSETVATAPLASKESLAGLFDFIICPRSPELGLVRRARHTTPGLPRPPRKETAGVKNESADENILSRWERLHAIKVRDARSELPGRRSRRFTVTPLSCVPVEIIRKGGSSWDAWRDAARHTPRPAARSGRSSAAAGAPSACRSSPCPGRCTGCWWPRWR